MTFSALSRQGTPKETLSTALFYFHDHLEKLSAKESLAFAACLEKIAAENPTVFSVYFKPQLFTEIYRKILMRFGFCHDVISLTQKEVADRILAIREKLQKTASISLPKEGARFLLRVDDYPSSFSSSDPFLRFHEIAREYGIPYLLAITPYFHENGLNDSEIKTLQKFRLEGMTPALHGFTHKRIHPGISSELLGLSKNELEKSLEKSSAYLRSLDLEPSVFIAPFNSYDPQTVSVLTEKFPIICGGPESVRGLGYRGTSFLGESLYLPSYRCAYDLNNDFSWINKMKTDGHGLIIPITLHWHNEVKNHFSNLKRLCGIMQSRMMSWDDILLLREKIFITVPSHD